MMQCQTSGCRGLSGAICTGAGQWILFCPICKTKQAIQPPRQPDEADGLAARALVYLQRSNYAAAEQGFLAAADKTAQDAPRQAFYLWCSLMARYGVEYVQEVQFESIPAKRCALYVPTFGRFPLPDHRITETKACQQLDMLLLGMPGVDFGTYINELDILLREIEQCMRNEQNEFDVFIAWHDRVDDNNGPCHNFADRLNSSLNARRDCYSFVSFRSLYHVVVDRYEPHIYAALASAKVMVIVIDDYDALGKKFLASEIKRFASRQLQDQSLQIYFCGMKGHIGQLPTSMSNLQLHQQQCENADVWVDHITDKVMEVLRWSRDKSKSVPKPEPEPEPGKEKRKKKETPKKKHPVLRKTAIISLIVAVVLLLGEVLAGFAMPAWRESGEISALVTLLKQGMTDSGEPEETAGPTDVPTGTPDVETAETAEPVEPIETIETPAPEVTDAVSNEIDMIASRGAVTAEPTEKPTPAVTDAPTSTPSPKPTEEPMPEPTATPTATPAPTTTPTPQSKAAPGSPTVSLLTTGIWISIPQYTTYSSIEQYDLYRTTKETGITVKIKSFDGNDHLTYVDKQAARGSSYDYFYTVLCTDGATTPNSSSAFIEWPAPTPVPRPTPSPMPAHTPTPGPKATPSSPTVSLLTTGIWIRLPQYTAYPSVEQYDLYRTTRETGTTVKIKSFDSSDHLTYVDKQAARGSSYDYFYTVLCADGATTPNSSSAFIEWPAPTPAPTPTPSPTSTRDPEKQFQEAEKLQADGKYSEALLAYRNAAEAGNTNGMNNLGKMYEEGLGTTQNDSMAVEWFRKAAEGDNPEGMKNLGRMYASGCGINQNDTEAVRWFRKAAEAGNASGMNYLGLMYQSGRGVTQNNTEATKWYREAAEAGNANGMNNLAAMYENGYGVDQDYSEAVKWYRKSAESGNSDGMRKLAWMYRNGFGVDINYSEAIKWYRKAIDAGNTYGMNGLAAMYENGYGVDQDYSEAVKWYRKSAESGNSDGMRKLAWMYRNGFGVDINYSEAIKWYRKAAEVGDAYGMIGLGNMYCDGLSVDRDYSEAIKWYRKAIDAGNTDALVSLGEMYLEGYGVTKDYPEALKWFRKAVEAGNAEGMCKLAYMYLTGSGVAKDHSEAVRWYRTAAETGNATGMYNMGQMYEFGYGVQQSYSEAAKWYLKATELGNANAMNNMGWLYQNGWGVAQDNTEAVNWYYKASIAGNTNAMVNLGRMYRKGLGVIQDYSKTVEWYHKASIAGNTDAMTRLAAMYENGDGIPRDTQKAKEYYLMAQEAGLDVSNDLRRLGY